MTENKQRKVYKYLIIKILKFHSKHQVPIELVPKLATTSTGTMSPLKLGLQFIDLRIPWALAAMIPLRN